MENRYYSIEMALCTGRLRLEPILGGIPPPISVGGNSARNHLERGILAAGDKKPRI